MKKIINKIGDELGIQFIKHYPKSYIKYIANLGNDLIGAEIGVWKAKNTCFLVNLFNLNRLYLVDPFGTDSNYNEPDKLAGGKKAEKIARKRVDSLMKLDINSKKEIYFVKKTSDEFFKNFKIKLDFIYIDGNHSYEYVKRDLENSYKIVRSGGIIAGDDFPMYDVAKAVVEFANKYNLNVIVEKRDFIIFKKD